MIPDLQSRTRCKVSGLDFSWGILLPLPGRRRVLRFCLLVLMPWDVQVYLQFQAITSEVSFPHGFAWTSCLLKGPASWMVESKQVNSSTQCQEKKAKWLVLKQSVSWCSLEKSLDSISPSATQVPEAYSKLSKIPSTSVCICVCYVLDAIITLVASRFTSIEWKGDNSTLSFFSSISHSHTHTHIIQK